MFICQFSGPYSGIEHTQHFTILIFNVPFISLQVYVLRKLRSRNIRNEWAPHLDSSNVLDLAWIYCPAHAGVRGNERADRFTSVATVAEIITMDKKWFRKCTKVS